MNKSLLSLDIENLAYFITNFIRIIYNALQSIINLYINIKWVDDH